MASLLHGRAILNWNFCGCPLKNDYATLTSGHLAIRNRIGTPDFIRTQPLKDEITVINEEIVSMVGKQLKRWKYHVKAWKVILKVGKVTAKLKWNWSNPQGNFNQHLNSEMRLALPLIFTLVIVHKSEMRLAFPLIFILISVHKFKMKLALLLIIILIIVLKFEMKLAPH